MSTSPQIANTLARRTSKDGVVYYVSPLLERAGVPHAFSTRIGGTSPPPFDSFNLGNPNGIELQDDRSRIARHYDMLQSAIGCANRERCYVHQVHGERVVRARANEDFDIHCKADALVTSDARRVLSVRTADCVPILLATADGRRVAAVHAGWRGVIARIIDRAVEQLDGPLLAAIGPCIGFDAFEVGDEVIAQFRDAFGEDNAPRFTRPRRVDLREAVRIQLIRAGVESNRIDTTDRCTFRDANEFYSHRRDRGVTGRMASLIGPAARG